MKRFLFCFPQRSAVLARQRMASILYMDRLDCPEDTVKYLKRDIRKVIEKYLNIENADVSIKGNVCTLSFCNRKNIQLIHTDRQVHRLIR